VFCVFLFFLKLQRPSVRPSIVEKQAEKVVVGFFQGVSLFSTSQLFFLLSFLGVVGLLIWFIQPSSNDLDEEDSTTSVDSQLDQSLSSSSISRQTKQNLSALAEDEDGRLTIEERTLNNNKYNENNAAAQTKRRADILKLQSSDIQSTQKSSSSKSSHRIDTIYESTTESSIVEEKIREKKLFENLVEEKERFAQEESAKKAQSTAAAGPSPTRSESSEKLGDLILEENIEATLDFLSCFSKKSDDGGGEQTTIVEHQSQKSHQQNTESSKSTNLVVGGETKSANANATTTKQELSESTDNLVEQLIDDLVADEKEQYAYSKKSNDDEHSHSHKSRATTTTTAAAADAANSSDTGSTVIDNDSSTSRNSILGNE
jgi:hypothetical protein